MGPCHSSQNRQPTRLQKSQVFKSECEHFSPKSRISKESFNSSCQGPNQAFSIDLIDLEIFEESEINKPYLSFQKAKEKQVLSIEKRPKAGSISSVLTNEENLSLPFSTDPLRENFSLKPLVLEEKMEMPRKQISIVKPYFQPKFIEEVFQAAFSANLEPYDTYETLYKDPHSSIELKIWLISYKSVSKKSRINKFRTEFVAPCTAKEYVSFANDLNIQKKLDTYCSESSILESLSNKIRLQYLSYRKTIVSGARDFVYLKTIRKIERDGKVYWCDASRSVQSEEFPAKKNVMRCEIIKGGYLVEDLKDGKCRVRMYSECDFKIDLPLFVVRNFSAGEMKKFVEKTIKKILEIRAPKKL